MKIKNCKKCGLAFSPESKGYRVSRNVWGDTKFCSKSCSSSFCNKGRLFSTEHRKKLSEARKKNSSWNSGVKVPQEIIEKGYGNWQGGITKLSSKIRNSQKYKNWRHGILVRDNFTCQGCGQRGVKFHVHHVFHSFAYLMKTFSVKSLESAEITWPLWVDANGQTLCIPCHKATDTYLVKKKYKND